MVTTTKTTFTSLKAGCHLRLVVPVVSVVFQKPQSDCCAHAAACKVVPRHHISYNKVLSYRQLSCQLKPRTVSRATTAALSIALQAIPPHTNLQHTSTRTDQPVRQYLVSTSLSDLSIIFCALVFTTTETTGYLTLLRLQRAWTMPQLHPGCRCALPWAMRFCAYSACRSIHFLRTSSLGYFMLTV